HTREPTSLVLCSKRYGPSRSSHVLQSFPRTDVCPSQNKFAIPRHRVPSDGRARQVRPKISAALESPRESPALVRRSILARKLLSQVFPDFSPVQGQFRALAAV